jgi:hypothetical protein
VAVRQGTHTKVSPSVKSTSLRRAAAIRSMNDASQEKNWARGEGGAREGWRGQESHTGGRYETCTPVQRLHGKGEVLQLWEHPPGGPRADVSCLHNSADGQALEAHVKM